VSDERRVPNPGTPVARCPACGQPSSAAAELGRLQADLRDLHNAHPTAEMGEAAQNMITQLHIAVHGITWARPESPEQVWERLLAEVIAMRERAEPKP
jgi:hypothetical protein